MTMQPPLHDPEHRRRRRRRAPIVGAIIGAIAGLVIAGVLDLVTSDVTPVGFLGGALVGAVAGFVLAMLVPAEIDDGEDEAHAAIYEHPGGGGRADAPVEGARARDAR
jgi:ammonia channel protein AmtB